MVALNILQALAALYVLAEGVVVLNRMSNRTVHSIRLVYLALTTGAVAAIASSFGTSNAFECFFAVGVAMFLAFDRRKNRRTAP